jgi:mannose-6-phosphate isomerase
MPLSPRDVGTVQVTRPRRVEKPWGHELIFAQTERYVGKLLHIEAGHSLSRQYHAYKEETLHVLHGTIRLEIGEGEHIESTEVGPGEAFHLVPGTIHRFTAEETTQLLEVSTPELDDVIRLEDAYGREGTTEA